MRVWTPFAGLVFAMAGLDQISAETWITKIGDRWAGKLSGVYGKVVLITGKQAST